GKIPTAAQMMEILAPGRKHGPFGSPREGTAAPIPVIFPGVARPRHYGPSVSSPRGDGDVDTRGNPSRRLPPPGLRSPLPPLRHHRSAGPLPPSPLGCTAPAVACAATTTSLVLHRSPSSSSTEEKEPIHTSSLTGAKKVREILEGHESWCKSEFRMEPAIFKATTNFLRRENLLRDTRGVTIEEQLGMFMYMISHNASNQMLQKAFQQSGETIYRKISEVFDIVPTPTQRFVKLPRFVQTHTKIAIDSRNCIGAIDGTHIPITIAEDRAPQYRNRKGTLSHNVMVVCDFDLNFTFVSCGWEGSASDAGVLRSAISKGFSVPEGKFYLVDGGYANTPSFIAPYRGVRYHLNQFRRRRSSHNGYENYKELFNHRHAILRNHIERAIGVLKKRFPILKVGTFHPIENQIKIAAATIAFHNIIRGQNGDKGWLDNQPDYISPSQYVDVPKGDNNYLNDTESSDGSTLRD
ncbi:hypothetical protein U9M48_003362, partial [Paspalum notatum var. saurae]